MKINREVSSGNNVVCCQPEIGCRKSNGKGYTDENDRISFHREVEILAGLEHPTLLGLGRWVFSDSGKSSGILTEFPAGDSLRMEIPT
jgi:hypothetical protein